MRRLPKRYIMEPLVRPFGAAFTGKHARWVFALALKGENAGSIGELAREIFSEHPA